MVRPVIIGQFGPPTLACIRSWGEKGFPVGMVCVAKEFEPFPVSKYLVDAVILPPRELYMESGIKIIADFVTRFKASGIICIDEKISHWVNSHKNCIPRGTHLWIPSNESIVALTSKEWQIELANQVGLEVLPTFFITENPQSIACIPSSHYPLCLRPSVPAHVKPVFKVILVHSRAELFKFVNSMLILKSPIIAQPFKNLPNLVVHGARTISGASIGLQAFLVERKFDGLTLTIRPINMERELETKCIEFTEACNLTGCYHFEFLADTNSTYFLEINNRLGGTTAKVYACGYNEPAYALAAFGVDLHVSKTIRNIVSSSRQALVKYMAQALTCRLSPIDYPEETQFNRFIHALQVFYTSRDDIFHIQDLPGAVALYSWRLRSEIARLKQKQSTDTR
jgi:hypothetical protein